MLRKTIVPVMLIIILMGVLTMWGDCTTDDALEVAEAEESSSAVAEAVGLAGENYFMDGKFWLHRANWLEKLRDKGGQYAGVELDLHWYDDALDFDVSHDMGNGIYAPLEDFFAEMPKDKKIWLDYKNLSRENSSDSMARLTELMARYGIERASVIVESPDYRALAAWRATGFYTSYYVPLDNAFFASETGQQIFGDNVRQAADSGAVNAVSFPITYYDLVKPLDLSVDFLTWADGYSYLEVELNEDFARVKNDPQVKVVLVEDATTTSR